MNNKLDWGSYSDFLAVITATIKLVHIIQIKIHPI